jgi:hypothetical protein
MEDRSGIQSSDLEIRMDCVDAEVSSPLHEHVRVYLKQGLGPLSQEQAV